MYLQADVVIFLLEWKLWKGGWIEDVVFWIFLSSSPLCQLASPVWLSTLQFCHLNAGAHLPMCKTRFLWCFFAGVPMLHSGFSSAQDNCDWFKGAKCKDLNWKVANCYIFLLFKRNSDKQKCVFPQYQEIIGAARSVSGADVVLWRLGAPLNWIPGFKVCLPLACSNMLNPVQPLVVFCCSAVVSWTDILTQSGW